MNSLGVATIADEAQVDHPIATPVLAFAALCALKNPRMRVPASPIR
jgi:hypothetical protein